MLISPDRISGGVTSRHADCCRSRRHLGLVCVLSWLLHAIKWLLIVAIIASLAVVAAKYLLQRTR
jgi:hypothetical protein